MDGKKKQTEVELRSEDVKDILGHVPSWIVRWGMLTFLGIILLLFLGSWVFKYPHVIKSPVHVTTENPPSKAIARTNGKIQDIFVEDNQQVVAGEVLAIIENTSEYEDIKQLKIFLDSFRNYLNNLDEEISFFFPQYLTLGDLQPDYANFLKHYEDLKNFINLNYHNRKVESIESEIKRYQAYSWTFKKQSNILRNEMQLARNQFNRDSLIYSQGLMATAEYESSRAKLYQKQRAYEESRSVLVNNDIQINKLEQEILDLKLQRSDELSSMQLAIIEAYDNLVSRISEWEYTFVLRSNVKGVVSFTRIWSENQDVREGDLVMTVIPDDAGDIIGKVELQLAGSGKVQENFPVNVKFENYPYMEYGMVRGYVKSISLVTENNAYSVLVEFPEGLETNYGKNIRFSQDMQGTAEIITNKESLLERIVNPVKSVLMRQKELRQ